MQSNLLNLTYEVALEPGEKLTLPQALLDSIGTGRWLITIQPFAMATAAPTINDSIRDHSAFLNSYAPEDEGLYDEYSAR